jgi:Zn-dependent protease/CBS domain-containing protein
MKPPRAEVPTRSWSWKLATIAGIGVHVHASFLLLLALVAFWGLATGRGLAATAQGMVLLLAIFTAVVLHEFGHALTARRFGVRTHDITLLPIGGVARLEKLPERPVPRLLVALSGPAVNVAIALLLFGLARLLDTPLRFADPFDASGSLLARLMWVNVSLAAFNLLPAFPMDGGRILQALLSMRMTPERATQVAARVGQGAALAFGLAGLFGSPMLLLIAVFVWFGARAEHAASTTKLALAGLSTHHAMLTDFQTLSPTDPLSRALDLTLAGFQRDFPVVDGARPVGLLSRGDVLKSVTERGTDLSVRQAMRNDFETASPGEALDGALTRVQQGGRGVLMVVENEALVGLLTAEGIDELLALGAAVRQNDRSERAYSAHVLDAGEAFMKHRTRAPSGAAPERA